MKVLVLAALIAVAASGQLNTNEIQEPWPWQVGKLYSYDVEAHTLARLQEGASTGTAFKANFIIRVLATGKLMAKLQKPQRAQVHQELPRDSVPLLPTDLKYEDVNMEQPFEITMNGGRVLTLNLPTTVSLAQENLLKGLISALQVDLSTHRLVGHSEDSFDKRSLQGQFKKMETDVTGDCETLYTVSPVASEWRREIPVFATAEEPIEITKSKNYGHCHYRVAYHFGVPKNAEWTGTASRPNEEQFIKRNTYSRILVAKQGPIYKAEVTTAAHVLPLQHGQQEAEVHSHIKFLLKSIEQDKESQWQKPEGGRVINSLLYSLTSKQLPKNERHSEESNEHVFVNIDVNENRVRRSLSPKISSVNKLIVHNKQNDWQSSSSSESGSVFLNDEVPNNNEPAFAALYMIPQSHADKKQNQMNAQKLLQDMAQGLQNSNNLPKADVLTKFNILVRLIASMSYDQLSQTSRSIEIAKTSNNIVKTDMWMIYRDAVAQAGTLPAFRQIKTWILNKKLVGEEAAEIVASLVNTVRYPTKDIMIQFFQLAMSPEVKQQSFLNTTALIAATRFINMAQVNNETAHTYYPTHMYGRLARQHDNFVVEEVMPQLRQQLSQSLEQDNSYMAQVYIKALGNLGHRAVLEVFAPYIEGKVVVSNYLRSQMVENLQVLAHQKDKYARVVLYSILKNTAETDEVRISAIFNIFMARPTGPMMQAMAQMTNEDPSLQVRAALKSAIESAAKLQNVYYLDLSRTAQAALPIVTKERFGYQHSFKRFDDYFESINNLGVFTVLSKIGSQESLLPQRFQFSWKNKIGGWNKESTVSASTSSVQKLIQFMQLLISQQQQQQQSVKSEANHKYSAEKVSEMLNIKRNPKNPLEFSVNLNVMNQERFFAFDESDISQISIAIAQYMAKLSQGVEKHYTKMLNQEQISIMFPVAMGMPFIYKYKEPVVVHIQSNAKVDMKYENEQDHYIGSMNKEIQLTFARNLDGSVGFLDTLADQYASVGVVNKFQITVPVKLLMEIKSGQVKIHLEPLYPEQDTTILHYSVWPYAANQKKDTLVTIAQDPSTKIITRPNKVVSIDSRIGQSVGMQFQLQGYSYSEDFRNFGGLLQSRDLLSRIAFILHQKDIALTHYNFRYLAKQSPNKRIVVSAVYDHLYNQKSNEGNLVSETPRDVTPNSQVRREEMMKRVASGIINARTQVVDLSAVFEGSQKSEFVLTAAIGESPIDKKIQYALFAGKHPSQQNQGQINAVGTVMKPTITSFNFLEALQKELKMTFNMDIIFGQNNDGKIQIQGEAQRTKKYAEALLNSPKGKMCAQEIAKNNMHLYVCHKMIIMAHAPDYVKASVTYKDVSPAFKYMTFQIWRYAEYLGFWNSESNPLKTTVDGKLEMEAQAYYLDKFMNLALNTRTGEYRIKNIPIPRVAAGFVSTYTPFKPVDRVMNYFTKLQYEPLCSVEANTIKTYSNRQYEYTLSPAWHVLMQDEPQEIQQRSRVNNYHDQLVVLARKPSENKQEVYISYKSENGQALEIELKPVDGVNKAAVRVNTNAKKVSDAPLTMYWQESTDAPLLQYYNLPDGALMLNIRQNRLRMMYDGQRLLLVSNGNRNNTRGICGQMSGDYRDDFQTPNGLVDRTELYGASFALNDDLIDTKTKELQVKAKQLAYPRQTRNTIILHSDNEWTEALQAINTVEDWGSQIIYRARNYNKDKGECQVKQQVQFYENHGEICITTTPLPSCQSHCRGQNYKVQATQVVCKSWMDQEFRTFRDQIRQGMNPHVTGVPQMKQYRVPTVCSA